MQTRKAARTVIFDENNKVAILEVRGGLYHKIPGGGIEDGENEVVAASREATEEAGCDVEIIERLGESDFIDPADANLIHHSVCYLAKKTREHPDTNFTEHEVNNNFRLIWLDINSAIKLFENVKSDVQFEVNMNNRDLKFLQKAKEMINI